MVRRAEGETLRRRAKPNLPNGEGRVNKNLGFVRFCVTSTLRRGGEFLFARYAAGGDICVALSL